MDRSRPVFCFKWVFIALLLIKEYRVTGKINLRRFYIRRLFKTLPVFYCAVAVDAAYFIYKGVPVETSSLLSELFFIQNYHKSITGVTWSLAIEEHFYILIGLAASILILKKVSKPFPWIAGICVAVMVGCLLLRLINNIRFLHWTLLTHQWPTHLRIDALATGVFLACSYSAKRTAFEKLITVYKWPLFLMALFLLVPAFCLDMPDFRMNTFDLTANYISFGILLSLLVVLPQKMQVWFRFFTQNRFIALIGWVGRYSYTIYLFHFLFGFGISSYIKKYFFPNSSHYFGFVTYLLAAVLVGWVISRLVEHPFLKLRDKWFPKS